MKSVQIRSFFWSVFSCIWNECRKIGTRKKNPYLDTFHAVFKTQQTIKQPVLLPGFHYLRIKTYDFMTVWSDRYSAAVWNHPRLAASQTSQKPRITI